MGDGTDLPISKSGSTAHFEAPVIASRIASLVRCSEDQLRRSRHVLPGDGEPQGDGPAIRLRTPAYTAEAQHDLACGEWMFNRVYWETVPQGPGGTATAQRRQPMSARRSPERST